MLSCEQIEVRYAKSIRYKWAAALPVKGANAEDGLACGVYPIWAPEEHPGDCRRMNAESYHKSTMLFIVVLFLWWPSRTAFFVFIFRKELKFNGKEKNFQRGCHRPYYTV